MENFSIRDNVYFFVEYEGLLYGEITDVNIKTKPKSYIIKCNNKSYPVSRERMFYYKNDCRKYMVSFILDQIDILASKLNYSHKDIMIITKLCSEGDKYSKSQLDKLLHKKVEVILRDDKNYTGILSYKQRFNVNEIIYENLYYLIPLNFEEPKNSNYITFLPRQIKKIKEIK